MTQFLAGPDAGLFPHPKGTSSAFLRWDAQPSIARGRLFVRIYSIGEAGEYFSLTTEDTERHGERLHVREGAIKKLGDWETRVGSFRLYVGGVWAYNAGRRRFWFSLENMDVEMTEQEEEREPAAGADEAAPRAPAEAAGEGTTPATPEPSAGGEPAPSDEPPYVAPFFTDQVPEYEIVEPADGEESEDSFARIPAGPTEEVRFEDDYPRRRRPRRERERDAKRRGKPAAASQAVPRTEEKAVSAPVQRRAFVLAVIAAAILLALIVLFVIAFKKRNAPSDGGLRGPASVAAFFGRGNTHVR